MRDQGLTPGGDYIGDILTISPDTGPRSGSPPSCWWPSRAACGTAASWSATEAPERHQNQAGSLWPASPGRLSLSRPTWPPLPGTMAPMQSLHTHTQTHTLNKKDDYSNLHRVHFPISSSHSRGLTCSYNWKCRLFNSKCEFIDVNIYIFSSVYLFIYFI